MVKAYLRYVPDAAFGVIASNCNAVFNRTGDLFLTAALESVAVWKVRTGQQIAALIEQQSTAQRPAEVKTLRPSPKENLVAAGYSDGSVRVWDLETQQLRFSFHGHKRPVTRLAFTASGELLASGAQDTCICIWDVIGEVGLFKLQGHGHEITGLSFLQDRQFLVSSAKDGQLKLWELESQHCCQTLLHEKGVIWSLNLHPVQCDVVVGSVDQHLLIYELTMGEVPALELKVKLKRSQDNRVRSLEFSADGKYLACRNATNSVELFEFQSEAEAKERLEKRQKEAQKVLKDLERKKAKDGSLNKKLTKKQVKNEKILQEKADDIQLYQSLIVYESSSKITSVDFHPGKKLELGVVLNNNAFEIVTFTAAEGQALASERKLEVHQCGHRSGVRSLVLSSDNQFLLSLSEKEAKVWNSETGACVHTLPSGYGLTGLFAPGDSIVVVGTKTGELQLFDLLSSTMLESQPAHEGPIWSMTSLKTNAGFISGSADGWLKMWKWGLKKVQDTEAKRVTIRASKRSIKLDADVLSVTISPNGAYLAAALLDATIRILHLDSFNVFLTLYGHKLPVLSIDISADNQLLVSGSADKNIKIWGLDFGDCHKSLFAHNDSVTQVAFVHTTHYVMTVGKDGMLKYWDADKFELLLELSGHHAEIWCLAVSHEGDFLFTGSNDRSIRKWIRTDEPFFLEDEKEKRMEALFDEDITDSQHQTKDVAGQQTISTVTAADSIIEALELSALESKRDASEDPNPLLRGLEPAAFVLRTVQNIKSSDLEIALLTLSFGDTLQLLGYLADWLKKSCSQTETICRIIVQLMMLHHQQLSTSLQARSFLQNLQTVLKSSTGDLKNTIGFNLEGVRYTRSLTRSEKTDLNF